MGRQSRAKRVRETTSSFVARARALPDPDLEEELIETIQFARVLMIEVYRRGETRRMLERRGVSSSSAN